MSTKKKITEAKRSLEQIKKLLAPYEKKSEVKTVSTRGKWTSIELATAANAKAAQASLS